MIVAWRVSDLLHALGFNRDQTITGIKLTLDGDYVEIRMTPNLAVDQLVYALVERHGNAGEVQHS